MKTAIAPILSLTLILATLGPAPAQAAQQDRERQDDRTQERQDRAQEQQDQVQEQQDREEEQQEEEERQEPRLRDARFIFVEGSMPWIPSSSTIVTKLPLSRQRTPFHVGIVTGPLFREQFSRTLSDALENVSNVNVQPGFGGVHDFFVIRGFDSLSSGLVLTDGAAEPEVTFYELYNVEAVEVLKGPAGFLYGSNPLAGAVNLVRKQPIPSTLTRVEASAGRFDHYEGALDFNWATPDREYSFRLNSMFRDAGAFRDGIESRSWAVNPAFAWQIDDDAGLNLNFEFLSSDYVPDSGLPLRDNAVPDVPRTRSYGSPFDDSDQDVVRFQADYQNRISDSLTVRDKLYYRDLRWDSAGTFFNGVFPVAVVDPEDPREILGIRPFVSRSLLLLDDHQRFLGNQLEAIVELETGTVEHDLMVGFELARFADEFTFDVAELPLIDLIDPVETASGPPTLLPGQSQAGDSRSLVAAPYVSDQIRLADRFNLLIGARLDHIDFEDPLRGVGRTDTKASPMVGATFLPVPEVSLFANFSRSFAPPTARVQDGQQIPEEGEQVEAGVKADLLDGRARATFAVYRIDRDNIAIPDDIGFTQQVGSQRSQGFELELAAEPRRGLRAVASYAFNDAELTNFNEQVIDFSVFPPRPVVVDRSGNVPTFAPRHLLDLWVGTTLPFGLGIGGGARWTSEQFIAEDNRFVIDDVVTVDATATYEWEGLTFQLSLQNLTDEEYPTRSFGSTSVIPADPITAHFGIGFRL